jgi:hypothetical protein
MKRGDFCLNPTCYTRTPHAMPLCAKHWRRASKALRRRLSAAIWRMRFFHRYKLRPPLPLTLQKEHFYGHPR